MVKGYGKKAQVIVISMKDNMLMIKKMGMGYLLGRVEMFTKVIMMLI